MGRISLENLGDRTKSCIAQMLTDRTQQGLSHIAVAGQSIGRFSERTEQPTPGRSLVIGSVATELITAVISSISGVFRGQRAETIAGEE
jgi:hypothetical protein